VAVAAAMGFQLAGHLLRFLDLVHHSNAGEAPQAPNEATGMRVCSRACASMSVGNVICMVSLQFWDTQSGKLCLALVPGLIACRNSNCRSSLISIGNFIQLPVELRPTDPYNFRAVSDAAL